MTKYLHKTRKKKNQTTFIREIKKNFRDNINKVWKLTNQKQKQKKNKKRKRLKKMKVGKKKK